MFYMFYKKSISILFFLFFVPISFLFPEVEKKQILSPFIQSHGYIESPKKKTFYPPKPNPKKKVSKNLVKKFLTKSILNSNHCQKNPSLGKNLNTIRRIIIFNEVALSSTVALGAASKIIAITSLIKNKIYNSFLNFRYPELSKLPTSILSSKNFPHIEGIKILNPDLIIYSIPKKNSFEVALKKNFSSKILLNFKFHSEDEFSSSLKCLAHKLKKYDSLKKILYYRNSILNQIKSKTYAIPSYKKPSILVLKRIILEYQLFPSKKFLSQSIKLAGGRYLIQSTNIDAIQDFFIEKSLIESINPEYILLTNTPLGGYPDHIYQSKDLFKITAFSKKQVYKIPKTFNTWEENSIFAPLFWILLSKLFHPELFQSFSLTSHIKEFFRENFNTSLSYSNILSLLFFSKNQLSNYFPSIISKDK